MVGKLTLFQEASATSQHQVAFHEDATWLKEWTALNQKSPKVVLRSTTSSTKITTPLMLVDQTIAGPYKWVQNWVSI